MNEEIIIKLCVAYFAEQPKNISRCAVGQGNYVYIVELSNRKVVVRCSEEKDAYKDTIYWLERLETLDIPVPRVLGKGTFEGYDYVILTYFEGQDIGALSDKKRAGDSITLVLPKSLGECVLKKITIEELL